MLNNTSQINTTDTEILSILDCNSDDYLYSLFEVATATPDCLF